MQEQIGFEEEEEMEQKSIVSLTPYRHHCISTIYLSRRRRGDAISSVPD